MKVKQNIMFVISLLLFLLTLVLGVVFAVALYKESSYQVICLTPGCIHSASTVLKYLNQTVDPCTNFYEFACGGFLEDAHIPEDSNSVNQVILVTDKIETQLKAIIDDPNQSSKLLNMIKKSYNICMNTTDFEVNGLNVLLQFLKSLGGWPLLEGDNWNGGTFEWKNLMYKFRKLGFPADEFIGCGLVEDKQNSSKFIISIREPFLLLNRSRLLNGFKESSVKINYDYFVDLAVLFGVDKDFAKYEINQTLHFTMALANITLPREKIRNETTLYNLMTIEELQINYPFIPWLEYITNLVDVPDFEITEDEVVNVASPEFLTNLGPLLRRTPKRVLANYVIEHVVRYYVSYLPKRFRDRQEQYYYTSGKKFKPMRKTCLTQAISCAPLAMEAAYIRKHFNKESKKQAEDMVENIRKTFYKMLKTSNWMEDETKKKALEKARSMPVYVGYPDQLLDDEAVEKLYLNVEIDYSSYIKVRQSLMLFFADEFYKLLRLPINITHWSRRLPPTTVRAVYYVNANSINIPSGIFHGIFFDNNRPRYMNYGAIGSIIGHEVAHAFHDGKDYNKDGKAENWWGEATEIKFAEKAQCVIGKYEKYKVPEMNLTIDGNDTLNENIADIAGVKAAYLAYQAWVKENGPEPRLPGLHFTSNQMFWISSAIKYCAKYRNGDLRTRLTGSKYSPDEFRVLGAHSNSEFFSKDFKCPMGSPMNPYKKCDMW